MSETMGEYQIIERQFGNLIGGNMRLIKLWTGSAWAEGPVWFRDGDFLLFSDRAAGHGQRLPPALQQHQRPHPRPAGSADLLRAWWPARVAHRARRHGRDIGRQLERQAPQLAQ